MYEKQKLYIKSAFLLTKGDRYKNKEYNVIRKKIETFLGENTYAFASKAKQRTGKPFVRLTKEVLREYYVQEESEDEKIARQVEMEKEYKATIRRIIEMAGDDREHQKLYLKRGFLLTHGDKYRTEEYGQVRKDHRLGELSARPCPDKL